MYIDRTRISRGVRFKNYSNCVCKRIPSHVSITRAYCIELLAVKFHCTYIYHQNIHNTHICAQCGGCGNIFSTRRVSSTFLSSRFISLSDSEISNWQIYHAFTIHTHSHAWSRFSLSHTLILLKHTDATRVINTRETNDSCSSLKYQLRIHFAITLEIEYFWEWVAIKWQLTIAQSKTIETINIENWALQHQHRQFFSVSELP